MTALRGSPATFRYAGSEAFAWLENRIARDAPVSLLATNEQPVPEGGIAGPLSAVLAVVKDSVGFEYALVPPSLAWVLFDTHHDELVYVRELPNEGGQKAPLPACLPAIALVLWSRGCAW